LKNLAWLVTAVLLLSVFASSLATKSASAQTGLVGYWKFDEGTGTTASDSSGNGNHGTLMNGPIWIDGKRLKALDFDGVDDYVEVPHSTTLTFPNFTLEAWIYLRTDIGNEQRRIISKQYTEQRSYSFDIFGNGYSGSTGNQLVLSIGNGATWINFMSTTHLTKETWYYVVGTHEGTTSKIYINGGLDKEGTTTTQTTDNPAPLTIGCSHETGPENPHISAFFPGIIDDVRIYDRALSQQEIQRDMGTVGGVVVPFDKLALLAPYIGLASTILVTAVATTIYVKRRKENQ
jgi:hypothetical protein